jgi:Patatin-like phospholipase
MAKRKTSELSEYDMLLEEYTELLGDPPPRPDHKPWPAWDDVPEPHREGERQLLYSSLHAGKRKALCLSGGGIRSATFAFGLIQRLADLRILSQFDYLSTVSGGGFIGSWLSSYARRHQGGIDGVETDLSKRSSVQPEPDPVRHLREYSNYLAPRLGLLSADSWALIGTYLRNLLLNWMVLLPLIFAFMAVSRLFMAFLLVPQPVGILPIAATLFGIALLYVACARPAEEHQRSWLLTRRLYSDGSFLWLAALPLTFCAALVLVLHAHHPIESFSTVFPYIIVASLVPAGLYVVRFSFATRASRRDYLRSDSSIAAYVAKKAFVEIVAAAASAAVLSYCVFLVLHTWFPPPGHPLQPLTLTAWVAYPPLLKPSILARYVCFGVPLILVALFVQAAVFVGLTSWSNEDYDREWWARAGGWIVMIALVWLVISAVTIYGPVALYYAPRTLASVGLTSGSISLVLGWSSKTAANAKQKDDQTTAGTVSNIALVMAAPVFVLTLLALISLVTSSALCAILPDLRPVGYNSPMGPAEEGQLAVAERSAWSVTATAPILLAPLPEGQKRTVTQAFPMVDRQALATWQHLSVLENSDPGFLLAAFSLLLAFSMVASLFIGVNRFSMNALYRNRLVRAYLGAPRERRRANPFSGFDPDDNILMHRLRPQALWPDDINVAEFGNAIKTAARQDDQLERKKLILYVVQNLEQSTVRLVGSHDARAASRLARELTALIDKHDLQKLQRAAGVEVCPQVSRRNRELLDSAFGVRAINRMRAEVRVPFHVVNAALNLAQGKELAWQERKAESFTFSPLHCGSAALGYRRSTRYGGPQGVSLGTAISISGAAVSPNMGYHSSPSIAFLLALFNIRLGGWLGNPGPAGERTFVDSNPRPDLRQLTVQPLVGEALGMTGALHPYVYLSDGGHFENLALYEMVRRRCHSIVLVDAGKDEKFALDDLGNAVRKIRIDFGIDIRVRHMGIYPRDQENPRNPKYCALGEIDYKTVDGGPDVRNGLLLYLKPAFYGRDEPKDIYNYASANPAFPHETTADQFFSESQFESYRALGFFAAAELSANAASVEDLIHDALAYTERQDATGLANVAARLRDVFTT